MELDSPTPETDDAEEQFEADFGEISSSYEPSLEGSCGNFYVGESIKADQPEKNHTKKEPFLSWSNFRVAGFLIAVTITPLNTYAFVPTLPAIIEQFNANSLEVALLVSCYLLLFGMGKYLWGFVLSCRKLKSHTILVMIIVFVFFTYLSCWPQKNIYFLIGFRSISAIPLSLLPDVGKLQHATKHEARMINRLSPVFIWSAAAFGGIIGGFFCYYLGWESTLLFVTILAVISFLILLIGLGFGAKENRSEVPQPTMQLNTTQLVPLPLLSKLLLPLRLALSNVSMFFMLITSGFSVGIFYLILLVIPLVFFKNSGFNAIEIGASMIPIGIAAALGSFFGNSFGQKSAQLFGNNGRLLPALLSALAVGVLMVLFGLTLSKSYWFTIITSTLVCLGRGINGPPTLKFCQQQQREELAEAANTILFSSQFVISAFFVFLGPLLSPEYINIRKEAIIIGLCLVVLVVLFSMLLCVGFVCCRNPKLKALLLQIDEPL